MLRHNKFGYIISQYFEFPPKKLKKLLKWIYCTKLFRITLGIDVLRLGWLSQSNVQLP